MLMILQIIRLSATWADLGCNSILPPAKPLSILKNMMKFFYIFAVIIPKIALFKPSKRFSLCLRALV